MSDFLNILVERSFAVQPALQPRLPSRFEPVAPRATIWDRADGIVEPREEALANIESPRATGLTDAGVTAPSLTSTLADGLPPHHRDFAQPAAPASAEATLARVGGRLITVSPTIDVDRGSQPTSRGETQDLMSDAESLHRRLDDLQRQLGSRAETFSHAARPLTTRDRQDTIDIIDGRTVTSVRPAGPILVASTPAPPIDSEERTVSVEPHPAPKLAPADSLRPVSSARSQPTPPMSPVAQAPPPRIVPEELPRRRDPVVPPTINVTIGRIEVKAVRDSEPARRIEPIPRSAVMSLEEYLAQRAAGGRR